MTVSFRPSEGESRTDDEDRAQGVDSFEGSFISPFTELFTVGAHFALAKPPGESEDRGNLWPASVLVTLKCQQIN